MFRLSKKTKQIKRILICQQRQLGDVLLATPTAELLAKHYPDAEIHFFTEKKCAPILENSPYIHQIIELDKNDFTTKTSALKFYWRTGRQNYDILVNLQHLPRCTWVAALSNAPIRIAPDNVWYANFLYNYASKTEYKYSAAAKASILNNLGTNWAGEKPSLFLRENERTEAQNILYNLGLSEKKFISTDVTHRDIHRLWPAEHFSRLMDMVIDKKPDLHFMLSYGPGEESYIHNVISMTNNKKNIKALPKVLPLRIFAACLEQACMHLGNCSAPRHMAVALDVPSFCIADARGSFWTFPSEEHKYIELAHIDANLPESQQHGNMALLAPEMVAPYFMAHLQKYAKI